MTKAIIIKKQGGPEVLELTDIKLGAPGPNEIKVKNIAISFQTERTYISVTKENTAFISCTFSLGT